MSIDQNRRILMAKAFGFARALSGFTEEERQRSATATLAEDYNGLVIAVGHTLPELIDVLPPRLEVKDQGYADGLHRTRESLTEVFIYCEQIYQVIAALEDE